MSALSRSSSSEDLSSSRPISPPIPGARPQSPAEGDDAIRVVCRVRPMNDDERARDASAGHACVRLLPDQRSVELRLAPDGSRADPGRQYQFKFHRGFGELATQREIYEFAAAPLVDDVLSGINVGVLAYGQTGSGKTFTMLGPDADDPRADFMELNEFTKGIMPRMLDDLFERIHASAHTHTTSVSMSYIEIYMEKLRDLLDRDVGGDPWNHEQRRKLEIRATTGGSIWIKNVIEEDIYSKEDVYRLMQMGNQNRHIAATRMNIESSRSHAILVLTIDKVDNATQEHASAQMYLVDLAGSEKVSKALEDELNSGGRHLGGPGRRKGSGQGPLSIVSPSSAQDARKARLEKNTRLQEAKKINFSLHTLGRVIDALTADKKKSKRKKRRNRRPVHVPYRDSKLTRLLANVFGGNAKACVIVNISPSFYNASESLSTLQFGARTSLIQNAPIANRFRTVDELARLLDVAQRQVMTLEQENSHLRMQLYSSLGIANPEQLLTHILPRPRASPAPRRAVSSPAASSPSIAPADPDADPGDPGAGPGAGAGAGAGADGGAGVGSPVRASNDPATKRLLEHSGVTLAQPVPSVRTSGAQREKREQFAFVCPLSAQVMGDPVVAMDGLSYERSAIEAWFTENGPRSPVTNNALPSVMVIPNATLRSLIALKSIYAPNETKPDLVNWLPAELLDKIFGYLRPEDLFAVCMVCRMWHQLAATHSNWKTFVSEMGLTVDPEGCLRTGDGRAVTVKAGHATAVASTGLERVSAHCKLAFRARWVKQQEQRGAKFRSGRRLGLKLVRS